MKGSPTVDYHYALQIALNTTETTGVVILQQTDRLRHSREQCLIRLLHHYPYVDPADAPMPGQNAQEREDSMSPYSTEQRTNSVSWTHT